MRQVPDNQEVFTHADSDDCVIVELLELDPEISLDSVAVHHFKQLASDNEATFAEITFNGSEPAPLSFPY